MIADHGINPERELSREEIREKLKDPLFLPTRKEITRAFASEQAISLDWMAFCFNDKSPVFELLNEEFITALSQYLEKRINELQTSATETITILEVGAGNGRLSHFLRQQLENALPGKIKVVATDSGTWSIESSFPVESMGHKEALETYQPQIVIFSWMPYEEDVTDDFRATASVQEYILIGEDDGGCCGDEWRTWGSSADGSTPPYEEDGFERERLGEIGKHQICRTDTPGRYYHSSTNSFQRKK